MTLYIGIVSGKGGVGKSLGYSEYVSMANGDAIKIGPYIDQMLNDNHEAIKYLIAKRNDGCIELFEMLTPPDELVMDTVHFDYDGQSLISEKRKPVYLMRKPAPEMLLRIKNTAGQIDVTEEHQFIIFRNGKLMKVEARNIEPKTDYLLYFDPKNSNRERKIKNNIPELLGYVMGDGYIEKRKNAIMLHVFAAENSSILNNIREAFKKTFGSYNERFDKNSRLHRISFFRKKPIHELFKTYKIRKVKASEKFIPQKIFESSSAAASFIRALFDCDAHVCKKRLEIQYDSKSERLAFQTASLLRTRFGIQSQVKYSFKKASNTDMQKQKYWRLNITGVNAIRYSKLIGFNHREKSERLKGLAEKIIPNTNVDVFPVGKLIREIRTKNNITAPQIARILKCSKQLIYEYERDYYALSRNTLLRFLRCLRELNANGWQLDFLENLAVSGYSFRRVEYLEKIKYKQKYVYDFQVSEEGAHFVHASGIVVSNTTSSINLGSALNYFNRDVTIVDGNLSTPNLGIYLGVPVVPINLHHVLQGKNSIKEAVYAHPTGTKIVPAGISLDDMRNTIPDGLVKAVKNLEGVSDIVIIDGAAGLGREALATINASDELIIITNPEMPAITDAAKTIKISEQLGKKVLGVVLTRTKPNNMDVALKNIETMLGKTIIGIIPEDKSVREAQVRKDAVVYTHPKSGAAIAYKKLAANLIGQDYTEVVEENNGFLRKVMKKIGLA